MTRLPLGLSKAFSPNLLDTLLAVFVSCLVMVMAMKLARAKRGSEPSRSGTIATILAASGAAAGSLTFAAAGSGRQIVGRLTRRTALAHPGINRSIWSNTRHLEIPESDTNCPRLGFSSAGVISSFMVSFQQESQ